MRSPDVPREAASMPATPQDLFARFDALGIAHKSVEHPPLHTVEDSRKLRGEIAGAHVKNLFVKDKKGRLFLLVAEEEARIDLKKVHELIGAQGRVSFVTGEKMEEAWGVKPGAVTPFGAINDKDGLVTVILEETLMREALINAHPLVNTMTTGVSRDDLVRFLEAENHAPRILAFAGAGAG
jgi:Ala-tRNA(Pro) deacylase